VVLGGFWVAGWFSGLWQPFPARVSIKTSPGKKERPSAARHFEIIQVVRWCCSLFL